MDKELERLLRKARAGEMDSAAIGEQRINFAHGNAGEGNEGTIEAVRAAATIMKDADKKSG